MTPAPLSQELESTNDISHYLGMLDPWYERNVLGLMHLPPEVLCQVSSPRGGEGAPAAVTRGRSEALVLGGPALRPPGQPRVRSATEPKLRAVEGRDRVGPRRVLGSFSFSLLPHLPALSSSLGSSGVR